MPGHVNGVEVAGARRLAVQQSCILALLLAGTAAAQAQSCAAQSSAKPPAVVELYTSEGCSSCPPADKWLSSLKGKDQVLALAFHVNYWDKLGWPDRFASPQITQRQHQLQRGSGAQYVYTPQVIVNGADTPAWSGTRLKPPAPSPLQITLVREGKSVKATVVNAANGTSSSPNSGAPAGAWAGNFGGYWAVLEDGHATKVRAGENAGETLLHDNVVVQYQPVVAWAAGSSPQQFVFEPAAASTPATAPSRRVVFVVTDGAGSKPLQVAVLAC
jgi:hypothetical protein